MFALPVCRAKATFADREGRCQLECVQRKPPWEKLAAELREYGVESPYLERVRTRVDAEQELRALQDEIAGEIARALGRTEERLNLAMAELDL